MPRVLAACLVLALVACEQTGDEGSADFDRAGAFRALAKQVERAAAVRYAIATENVAETNCVAAHGAYDRDVRPWIVDMGTLGPELDALIAAHDPATPNHADAACTQATLQAELDAHAAAACTGATIEDSRAEAARHIAAIVAITMHATARMDELIAGIESEAMDEWPWTLARLCP